MIKNLQSLIERKSAQMAKHPKSEPTKENNDITEAVLLLIQESHKKTTDMILAVIDNQKILNAKIDKILKWINENE